MTQITKKAIESSLKKLLMKKPFDKITINDIAEDCGISRMTFYYHFRDIYDLVEWSCEEDAKRLMEGEDGYGTWKEGLLALFNEIFENRAFLANVYHSTGKDTIETYLYKILYNLILKVVESKAQGLSVDLKDKEFLAGFYRYAFVGVITDWIRDGMKDDPEILVDKTEKIVRGNFDAALKRLCRGKE